MVMIEKEHCFIITPIGDESDPIRRHIEGIIDAAIKPALEDKYELIVAHKMSEPGSITKQVIREIYSSKLVVANLTGRNPNVMYELAFRHSLGKPVIMIVEKGTSLPSDIIMERTIFYQNDARGVLELRDDIVKAERKIKFENVCSPILDVIHEFEKDAQIVKIAETQSGNQAQDDTGATNVLKYILEKLNVLESSVQAIRNHPQSFGSENFPRKVVYLVHYDSISHPYRLNTLLHALQKVSNIEPDIEIVDVHVDEGDDHCITIFAILADRIAIPDVFGFFLKVLSEFGFTNAKVMPFCSH